jgi:hypothetical protein
MVKPQQQRYQMFLRVRDFGARYQDQFPAASAAGRAFGAVGDAIAEIERQSSERLVKAQAGKRARAAARTAIWERLHAIVRADRVVATGPPARSVFQLPARRSDVALLDTARSFIDAGEIASAGWVAAGLPETCLAELREMTSAFSDAIASRRAGQTGVKAARKALADALVFGFAAVRQLDAIVANTTKPDSAVAVAWKAARRAGPTHAAKEPAAPAAALASVLSKTTPANAPPAAPVLVTPASAAPVNTPAADEGAAARTDAGVVAADLRRAS